MKKGLKLFIFLLTLCIILSAIYFFAVYIPERKAEAEKEQIVREYYESKYVIYKEENSRYLDYEVDVAFIGDSLTDGYPLAEYYPDLTVSNRGIGGDTSFGLEERLQLSLYDLKPKAVVLLIGGNNLTTMLENYESILLGIKENLPNTRVIVCSLTAMGDRFAEKNKIVAYNNVVIEALAKKHGFAFVDLFSPLLDITTGEIYEDYTTDGAHLTPLGYNVLTEALTPMIKAELDKWE